LSVSKEVDSLLAATKASKVDIVSHSMGSLSSRYYIKELGGDKKVDEWVSLAGPNHGSSWAPFCSLKYVSCVEMKPKSTFLEELNEGDETPGAVNYKTWRSPRDLAVVPSRSVELTGAANEVLKGIKHSEFHEKKSIYEEVRNFVKN
jgi:triacylglycerol lipase